MKSMTTRRTAAVGTLLCALGATYVMFGLDVRGDALPNQDGSSAAELRRTIGATGGQDRDPAIHSVTVTASRYRFDPPVIEVSQGDLVRVELHTKDIAHSFTIDVYRIAKRVGPAVPVTFEFRADQAGTFPYYCSLQIDDGCRQMRGQLVVKPRR